MEALSIAEKELIPIIVACQAWGEQWKGLQVLCHSDGSGRLEVSLEQTQGHDAPVAYSGVRRGQAGMLPLASLH